MFKVLTKNPGFNGSAARRAPRLLQRQPGFLARKGLPPARSGKGRWVGGWFGRGEPNNMAVGKGTPRGCRGG